ncbi:phage head-tail connector protein [Oceanobacillus oncorhynchi subsp. incaldanensis]|uniref:phage head-tail connector protein n=1 Tax=Oceanobacillus oncorhynchi TaxID=545501 RepID=UPI001B2323E3|nr:phage head-tail connector protein [Oceanobacillus oncorhynchi]GIO18155.1 phage head-tail connector protein [Oceanobacillus oncorhynchi subsp. incaldanensis]
MQIIDKVKTLIGISDNIQDQQIEVIIENINSHLLYLLEKEEVPKKLQYIVVEIAIRRYNRLGSEGMQSDSVEGHSVTFYDLEKDFEPYQSIIDKEAPKKENPGAGRVKFY